MNVISNFCCVPKDPLYYSENDNIQRLGPLTLRMAVIGTKTRNFSPHTQNGRSKNTASDEVVVGLEALQSIDPRTLMCLHGKMNTQWGWGCEKLS